MLFFTDHAQRHREKKSMFFFRIVKEIKPCYWCKNVAEVYHRVGKGGAFCPKCIEILVSPNGRPPQPDARARLVAMLGDAKFPLALRVPDVAILVAMFVHDWTEP